MPNRLTNLIAIFLLMTMFASGFFSMRGISTTMDELAHIPAGYSYLSQKDYRLNPEHPPLIKDFSAIPLLFLNLNFPKNNASWKNEINSQWSFGTEFLYQSGNDADEIIFWARIPMLLILVLFGFLIFKWVKELAGNTYALFALTLFSFSPAFLANGRLVATDVAAAFGAVLATYFWLKFLKTPIRKNLIKGGLALGISLLFKFSLILLLPFFLIITLIYGYLKNQTIKYFTSLILAGLIALIFVIWPIYQFHMINYPPELQLRDTQTTLETFGFKPLKDLSIWMSDKPLLRAPNHYLFGLLMATQRTIGGNTVYFMNMIGNMGWWFYFPVVYFLKVPIALHILTLIALFGSLWLIKKPFWINSKERLKTWIKKHFTEFSMMIFLVIYWITSITGNLNIGVRHILPTFPFMYILITLGIKNWTTSIKRFKKIAISLVGILIAWYIFSSLSVFPNYLSYFNEIGGGPENGYKNVVDSNYDWGQDLKRLRTFVEEKNIKKIYIDYFGGGNPEYYLGDKYIPLRPLELKKEPKGWIAVSVNQLQSGLGNPEPGFNYPTGYYKWLEKYEPVAKAGNSIFIYYLK